MRKYKHISFGEGISMPLSEFKEKYASHLKDLSDAEVKEAYKVATNGNNTRANKKTPKTNTRKA